MRVAKITPIHMRQPQLHVGGRKIFELFTTKFNIGAFGIMVLLAVLYAFLWN